MLSDMGTTSSDRRHVHRSKQNSRRSVSLLQPHALPWSLVPPAGPAVCIPMIHILRRSNQVVLREHKLHLLCAFACIRSHIRYDVATITGWTSRVQEE
nr:hypothetical protein CFP56_29937 [Quercus suber]